MADDLDRFLNHFSTSLKVIYYINIMTEMVQHQPHRPVFSQSELGGSGPSFCAAFIDQPSYIELLRLSDHAFGLNMTSRSRVLPCQQHSYLVLSRSPPWKGIGRPVSLIVDSILYNAQHGVLLAKVKMKKNFTCNKVPHIIIAKRPGITNIVASHAIDDPTSKIQLCTLRVQGKIGVMNNSKEEWIKPVKVTLDGMHVEATNNIVTRPEAVYTVEQPLDEPVAPVASKSDDKKDVMEITLNKSGPSATGGTYLGEPIMKGPRGGCYIIKDGKKKYVPTNATGGSSKAELVYKINILE